MNKSKSPAKRIKSPFHLSSNSKKTQPSKSPAKRQFLHDLNIAEKLKNNRQKLSHTFDTYTMLIRSKNPIRCLEHNSIISIFCETENKLLCTNCVFGKNEHKFHRIHPIDKSFLKIKQNIQKISIPIEKEITIMNHIKEMVLNNLDGEIIQVQKSLQNITMKYTEAHHMLEQQFYEVKHKLLNTLEHIKIRNQTVAHELTFLKDIYNVKALLHSAQLDMNEDNQMLLYHHSLLATINAQKKFQGHLWNSPKNQIKVIGDMELKRITSICQKIKENKEKTSS